MTAEATRFVLSIEPITDESLPGYVARLAQRMLLPTADLVAAKAGLRQPGLAFGYASLSGLSALSGIQTDRLDAIAYRSTGRAGHYCFLGGTLQREFINLKGRRGCPECLRISSYHRAIWDFALATCCTDHGLRLLSRCPGCNRALGWSHPNLVQCRCGSRLATGSSQTVSAAEIASQAAVLRIATGGALSSLPPDLANCDRADLVRLVMCLGMFMTGWKRERRVETMVATGPDAMAEVIDAGIGCLRDWPTSLHRFFANERKRAAARRGKYGARKTLGGFYDWLNMMEQGPIRSALARVASDFIAGDPVLARQSHRSSLAVMPTIADRPISMLEAGHQLGIRARKVRRLVNTGLLSGQVSDGPGTLGLLDIKRVQRLKELSEDALDLAGMARALGISKSRVRRLVEGGMLESIHRGNAHGWGRWMFPSAAAQNFLTKLAPSGAGGAEGATVGFDTAMEVLRRHGIGFAGALEAMLDGRLPVAAADRTACGLKALRFWAPEVRTLAAEQDGPERPLTIHEAAQNLRLKWEVVAHLVAVGMISIRDDGIPRDALESFRLAYISGAELAKARNTSPRHLAIILAREGVRPIVGPEVDGSRQNFYRRDG